MARIFLKLQKFNKKKENKMGFWTALKSIFGNSTAKPVPKTTNVLDKAMQDAEVELDKFEPKKGFKPVKMVVTKTKKKVAKKKVVKKPIIKPVLTKQDAVLSVVAKRARNKKGRYLKDDKATLNVNEAWVGGKAPKKKAKKKTKKK